MHLDQQQRDVPPSSKKLTAPTEARPSSVAHISCRSRRMVDSSTAPETADSAFVAAELGMSAAATSRRVSHRLCNAVRSSLPLALIGSFSKNSQCCGVDVRDGRTCTPARQVPRSRSSSLKRHTTQLLLPTEPSARPAADPTQGDSDSAHSPRLLIPLDARQSSPGDPSGPDQWFRPAAPRRIRSGTAWLRDGRKTYPG